MDQKINTVLVLVVILAITIVVVVYMSLHRVDSWLKNNAIDGCARISKYKEAFDEKNATAEYPLSDVFENCLKLKGYSK